MEEHLLCLCTWWKAALLLALLLLCAVGSLEACIQFFTLREKRLVYYLLHWHLVQHSGYSWCHAMTFLLHTDSVAVKKEESMWLE